MTRTSQQTLSIPHTPDPDFTTTVAGCKSLAIWTIGDRQDAAKGLSKGTVHNLRVGKIDLSQFDLDQISLLNYQIRTVQIGQI